IDLKLFEDGSGSLLDSDTKIYSQPIVHTLANRNRRYRVEISNVQSRGATLVMTGLLSLN
ncbi:MAG: hypothetical protein AAFP90_19340, partial [Planctomycetota bacterium]